MELNKLNEHGLAVVVIVVVFVGVGVEMVAESCSRRRIRSRMCVSEAAGVLSSCVFESGLSVC